MGAIEITEADPLDPPVRELVEHHLVFGRSFTPLEDAHALEVEELLEPITSKSWISPSISLTAHCRFDVA